MLLDIFQNFLVNTSSLIFVKERGNITTTHDTKNYKCSKRFWNKGQRHIKFSFKDTLLRVIFADAMHCSRLQLWVGYFICIKFTAVFFCLMFLTDIL